MDGEHAFGALNIYSREPDPFSPEEVALLTELTNDLAYGIRTIQHAAAHRSMEEQLAAHARELATANKELESFAYSVSHDLRAPLRAIYSFCGMLEEDYRGNLDETGRDYLARISAGAGKMNGLIDDIMSLSLISSHEIMVKDVDISAMAAEILAELQQTQPRRTVQFTIEPGIRVCADPRLIKIALTNLLQNAWKYTGKKEETRIGFGRETGHGEPAFFVRDNGSGFDMNNVERLFKPFSRLHKEREFSGTGIGLAIVNRVITRHGGRIWAEGRVNEGAVFRFSLPKCEDRPNAVPEAGAAA
jgi:light-regulated signal transduction histidine kinase (bacteriophytochrome)